MEFVWALAKAPIPMIAIENPVSVISTLWRKPDQVIQPWQFGHEATKTTCLWLKNLPALKPTKVVSKGERIVFKSGKSHPAWYAEAFYKARTRAERSKMRSKTFQGIADAMAEQWGKVLPTYDLLYQIAAVQEECRYGFESCDNQDLCDTCVDGDNYESNE